MKEHPFKLYLFHKLQQYQEDLKLSDIVIINKNNETIKEKNDCDRMDETDHEKVQLWKVSQNLRVRTQKTT